MRESKVEGTRPKRQKTGGRTAGTPNKATVEVKIAARMHGAEAIATLANLMKAADSDAAKIAACKEILDRAYGKATQPVGEDPDMPFVSKEQRDAAVEAAIRSNG